MALGVNPRDTFPLLLKTLIDRGAIIQPDNLIVTKTSKGYSSVTFVEHQLKAQQLASALQRWGVRIGDRVGTLMWNSTQHLHCYHAISCMGAVLHTLNLRLSPKDLGFIIEHAADRLIFSDADLLALLAKVDASVLAKVELFVCSGADWEAGAYALPDELPAARSTSFEAFLATGSPDFLWPDVPETSPHALCYTSGTTGNPKGAAYSQRSTYLHTLASAGTDQLGLSGSHVILPFVPMFHVLSWGVPFTALMLGTRMVFTGKLMDPDSLLDAMVDWKIQFSTGVPTVWQGVKGAIMKRGLEKMAKFLHLKVLTCGGSSPPAAMMRWFADNLGVDFLQGWGMTETNPLGSVGRRIVKHKDLTRSTTELFNNITKAGLPIPGVEIRIADSEDLDKEMPLGTPGELLIRGPWIIAEYFQFDAKDKFHKGWLITGDVARLDEEGAINITDRSKDVIKSGGEWISSIDLENHISAMAEVAMAAVVAMPHPRWDERPVAVIKLADAGVEAGIFERVTEHCLQAFAKFQLPDDVLVWKEIPLTSTGKIDKKIIRQRLADEGYVLPTAKVPGSKL
mmetsp:Transcript_91499/g.296148  ORF Transcript_91499/g.296148 Transcript_91499/m.296148 type:complete len:568 (-) Transcript_91499:171-1874(-)